MNPLELAKKIESLITDYDRATAFAALKIAEIMIEHRESVKFAFEMQDSPAPPPPAFEGQASGGA